MEKQEITSIITRIGYAQNSLSVEDLSDKIGVSETLAQDIINMSKVAKVDIFNDQPAEKDAFGMRSLVKIIADVSLSERTQTPISIAIDGEWGTGKTSIMRMVENHAHNAGYPCIWLNAWSLEDSERLIATMASEIQREIDHNKKINAPSDKVKDGLRKWMELTGKTLLKFSGSLGGSVTAAVNALRDSSIADIASIVTARASFENLVSSILENAKKQNENTRLIIFIDDVDRALPDQITDILKNLKLILEVPNCVFIMAMDMKIVAHSIESYYLLRNKSDASINLSVGQVENVSIHQNSGVLNVFGENFGLNYLEKLIQIRVKTPNLSRLQVADYLREIDIIPEVQEIVFWMPDAEIMNPRRLKQYLNWLSISLQLITSVDIPSSVSNLLALQLMAIAKSYPKIYLSLVAGDRVNLERELSYVMSNPVKMISRRSIKMKSLHEVVLNINSRYAREFHECVSVNPVLNIGRLEEINYQQNDSFDLYERKAKILLEFASEHTSGHDFERISRAIQELNDNIGKARTGNEDDFLRDQRARIIRNVNAIAIQLLGMPLTEVE